TLFWGPRVLKLVPSISTLDGGGQERDDLHYVGHLSGQLEAPTATGFELERDKRYVFAYLGTGSVSLGAAERVLPAVFPADGERRCVVASSAVEPYRLGGVEFRRFVPAAEVLPVADWVLCHGGLNTVIESLRAGVPLLLFPGAIFERRFNATAVAGAGAGVMAETTAFTPAKLRAAMERHDELAAGARRLGAEIEARGGAVEAVRLMAAQFEPVPVATG
ncbi:MAG TPA: nucleotide disphospho-sugar-binding domain-containing protein, partial [Acidimicrobiales bacterium]|nr:nucleotide disphospho-sugar-binding domain-containing protein [Acidimicrobiales bacterium]